MFEIWNILGLVLLVAMAWLVRLRENAAEKALRAAISGAKANPDIDLRAQMRSANPAFFHEISNLLYIHDPIQLAAAGAPPDEYDPEALTILPLLKECKGPRDVQSVVHSEFCRWFGAETAGDADSYEAVAEELWSLWSKRRREFGWEAHSAD